MNDNERKDALMRAIAIDLQRRSFEEDVARARNDAEGAWYTDDNERWLAEEERMAAIQGDGHREGRPIRWAIAAVVVCLLGWAGLVALVVW